MPTRHAKIRDLFLQIEDGALTDLSLTARGTILRSDLEEAVRVDLEGGNEFSLATSHWRNSIKLKLSEQPVVAALRPLTLVPKNA